MLKILLGFLPWILYFALMGSTRSQHEYAILAALIATLVLDFHELKKGFILTWGTFIFFSLLLLTTLLTAASWPEQYANLIANSALAAIVWFSLLINKPFTLQYARQQVPEKYWQTQTFIRINQIITLVWGLSFITAIVLNIWQLYDPSFKQWHYQILSYLPTIIAIIFTEKFPNWYRQRK